MKGRIKTIIGDLLIALRPQRATYLVKNGMTIADEDTFTRMDYLMRDALLRKAEKNQDFDGLAEFHRNYWIHQGPRFFSRTQDRFENFFLSDCAFIFDKLQVQLSKMPKAYNTLVEIGTGDGEVLNYLSARFPKIDRFIGIDLSQEQVNINTEKFNDNSRLEFVASDGFDWVKAHGHTHTIFVTSGGVLEYFTQTRLQKFLKELKGLGEIIFIAIEPMGLDHDFTKYPESQAYCHERSFSHNYPKLFKQAGFEIWHSSKKRYPQNDQFYFSFIGVVS